MQDLKSSKRRDRVMTLPCGKPVKVVSLLGLVRGDWVALAGTSSVLSWPGK